MGRADKSERMDPSCAKIPKDYPTIDSVKGLSVKDMGVQTIAGLTFFETAFEWRCGDCNEVAKFSSRVDYDLVESAQGQMAFRARGDAMVVYEATTNHMAQCARRQGSAKDCQHRTLRNDGSCSDCGQPGVVRVASSTISKMRIGALPGFSPWRLAGEPISPAIGGAASPQDVEMFRRLERRDPEVLGPDVKCKRCETVAPRRIGPGSDYNGCHDIGLVPNVEGWTVAVVWTNAEGVARSKTYLCPACAPALLRSKADEERERKTKAMKSDAAFNAKLEVMLANEKALGRELLESGFGIEKTRDAMHETYVLDEDLLCADV